MEDKGDSRGGCTGVGARLCVFQCSGSWAGRGKESSYMKTGGGGGFMRNQLLSGA